jgi:beta-N-acetylhexosaminidase
MHIPFHSLPRKKNYRRTISAALIALSCSVAAQAPAPPTDSLDIKIGQMIMVGINNRTLIEEQDPLLMELQSGKLGGVVLFEKNIAPTDSKESLKKLIGTLKKNAPIPLLVTIDEEGGKVHRLKEKYGFVAMPSAAYLGKLNNPDSTLFYNRRLAQELAMLGINFNYAPSIDLAINPDNTVIVKRERSFSDRPDLVAKHAQLCIRAHHEHKVKTILKHFPGHGSSTADSHLGVVDVSNSWKFTELLPYHAVLQSGTYDAIMTAHIINRNWDTTLLPGTLSYQVVSGMLRGLLGYKGVVFSDDMQMHAISENYGIERSVELAVNAGVDILMYGNNVSPKDKPVTPTEIHALIKQLVVSGKISRQRINEAYTRIMKLKAGIL